MKIEDHQIIEMRLMAAALCVLMGTAFIHGEFLGGIVAMGVASFFSWRAESLVDKQYLNKTP